MTIRALSQHQLVELWSGQKWQDLVRMLGEIDGDELGDVHHVDWSAVRDEVVGIGDAQTLYGCTALAKKRDDKPEATCTA